MSIERSLAALAVSTLLATAITVAAPAAHAQAGDAATWPSKPVSMVIPYPPGGTSDIVGRQLAVRLRDELGGTWVIENKAGAATGVGATAVAHAPKDGYTLLLSAGTTFTTNPHLNDKATYKVEDFDPVGMVVTVPFVFEVRRDFPAKNVAEFVAWGKANAGKVNNATNGQGSMVHLLGELVANGLNLQFTQVHYKGAAPANVDMIAGVVDSNVEALTTAVPNISAGKYRALAMLSAQRHPLLPDVPTFRELGYPSIVGETWYAVFVPAGTPRPIIDKLNAALRRITSSASFAQAMRKLGNESVSSTPEELREITAKQSRNWGELIRRLGVKAE